MSEISLQYKPLKSDDIVFQSMPPDTVLLNLETGFYFSTNRLGAAVWEHCDGESDISSIIQKLHLQFDVSLEQLTEDVHAFIHQLLSEGLLKVTTDD